MNHYNPDKMIPREALGQVWTYIFVKGRSKALGHKPMPHGERKFQKEYHTRRARRIGKRIDLEDDS